MDMKCQGYHMYKLVNFVIVSMFITGCVTQPVSKQAEAGHFIHAGPVSVVADKLSIKWRYGFKFIINPKSIAKVSLSCAPIPGTTVIVKKQDLNINAKGIAFWNADVLLVSREKTPWLFDSNTTEALCEAIISRVGLPDITEQAPVTFTGTVKSTTLYQLKEAHKYNANLNK